MLNYLTGRGGFEDWQVTFARAGHAHAGVLLVLSLVYLLYLPRADYSDGLEWASGVVFLTGVIAQSGGFFIHIARGEPGKPFIRRDRVTLPTLLRSAGPGWKSASAPECVREIAGCYKGRATGAAQSGRSLTTRSSILAVGYLRGSQAPLFPSSGFRRERGVDKG